MAANTKSAMALTVFWLVLLAVAPSRAKTITSPRVMLISMDPSQ